MSVPASQRGCDSRLGRSRDVAGRPALRQLALALIAGALAAPLVARADAALESIEVRCGDGEDADCALQLEFSRPVHLGDWDFAIRSGPHGDFAPTPAFAPDPEHSTTVYLPLPQTSRGELGVRWSVRSADGRSVLRSEERTVRVE